MDKKYANGITIQVKQYANGNTGQTKQVNANLI